MQLLKGVGTKCWAPDAEYALHSVYQGGLFELRAGDEVFVSVSSPTMVNADDSSSYFGAFRLDLWEEGDGRKKRWDSGWINGWGRDFWIAVDWEKKGSFRRSCGMSACVSDPQRLLGRIHWRMEGFAWVNAARGWGEREKKEWICLPYSPLSGNQTPLRARYTNIHVQSLENKCENSSFLLIFWGRKLLFDVKERSKPQKSI